MAKASTKLKSLINNEKSLSISLRQLLTHFEEQTFGFLFVFLALPSALPIPAPGYSTPFGIALMIIALQVAIGKKKPWCPEKFLDKNLILPQKLCNFALKFLVFLEKFSKPRFSYLKKFFGNKVMGVTIIILSIIMAMPIPLTNTLPAAIILLFGLGFIEEDGLLLALTQFIAIIAIIIYLSAAIWLLNKLI